MKILLSFIFLSLSLLSCKKYIQQQEQNAVVSIMTSGVWYVYTYSQNDTSITSSFKGYTFKFYANGTMDAIKDSAVVSSGTWVGNVSNETINSNFQGATDPLDKLNSLWAITNSGSYFVVANTTINGNKDSLELVKQ